MEDVQAAIDARKPDFAAYVEPQKQKADIVVQVRPRRHRPRTSWVTRTPSNHLMGASIALRRVPRQATRDAFRGT